MNALGFISRSARWASQPVMHYFSHARQQGFTQIMRSWQPLAPSRMMNIDWYLVWCIALLSCLGCVMVYSASIAIASEDAKYLGNESYFLIRQFIFLILGVVAAIFVFRIPIQIWQQYAGILFILALGLLVLVLIPGVSRKINGAHRWINVKIFSFQPSEVMKFCVLLYAADFVVRKQSVMKRLTKGFLPMAVAVACVGALLMLQPDLGALLVIVSISMGILFIGGVNAIWFGGISVILVTIFSSIIAFSPWRRERMFAFLNPWGDEYALGKGYQLTHSLIAFGRGEITGVGLGNSVEKLHYLPEAHTDFLIAVIAEELGLIGISVIMILFMWLIRRAYRIGYQAEIMQQFFSSLVAKGIAIWFGVQVCVNVGAASGALPTKGLTLPFMSYGGSSLIINLLTIALLLRIDFEVREKMKRGRA